ncbi:hypothetical protein GDO81_004244 [Engystomops pustulosus]|uniref:Uncharacterized protein n=1 Tax=Engystomops pustulosus TaxID=76066 RepID=A0AAV6ZR46_ENGPU|nr:hypothetical protein GDO81_004244 [Engystomops pustulosus]
MNGILLLGEAAGYYITWGGCWVLHYWGRLLGITLPGRQLDITLQGEVVTKAFTTLGLYSSQYIFPLICGLLILE